MTDPNSHSNPEECLVTHISLLWDVDFERKVLSGSAELTVERQTDTADKIVSSKFLPYWLDKPVFGGFFWCSQCSQWNLGAFSPILKKKSQYSKESYMVAFSFNLMAIVCVIANLFFY